MTNNCLMDSDEKATVDVVRDHKDLYDKSNKHFKNITKQGRNVFGRCLPIVASCQSVQDLV